MNTFRDSYFSNFIKKIHESVIALPERMDSERNIALLHLDP